MSDFKRIPVDQTPLWRDELKAAAGRRIAIFLSGLDQPEAREAREALLDAGYSIDEIHYDAADRRMKVLPG